MVKYFCDKCGNEIKLNGLAVPTYIRDNIGVKIVFIGNKHLCEDCIKKFNMVKDRLEHAEDFFDMSDEDISLMEYDFKVGDEVVTSDGEVGIIESICDCERCKVRGFYEPQIKLTEGVYDIYITDNDKNNGFSNFYRIGKYKFGNVDIESIRRDIDSEERSIAAATKRLETYQKQLVRMLTHEALEDGEML
jgi:hypothetical protein